MAVDALKKSNKTLKRSRGTSAKNSSKNKPDAAPSGNTDTHVDTLDNWADDPESDAYIAASKLYDLVIKQYENQDEQAQAIVEYWNIFNAEPDDNQVYQGNSQGYIPAVRDALIARSKRALKQLFSNNYKHVDGLSSDGKIPYTQLSLQEYYIRKMKLQSIVRSDLLAGDVTGQWGLLIDWSTSKRNVTKLVKRNPIIESIDGDDITDLDIEDPTADEEEDTEEEEIIEEGPDIVDFATADLAVIPPTCNNLQKAKAVSIRLRLSEAKIDELVDEGVLILPEGVKAKDMCKPDQSKDKRNPQKKAVKDAGVKTQGTDKHALILRVFTKLDFGGEFKEEAEIYFYGQQQILGIIKNPLWSGKRPIISAPVDRIQGSFFGRSKIEPVKFLQWNATDAWNMGQDSAMYSMLPVFAVDPMKCPQWPTLTLGLAAIWNVPPDGVKAITFPQLWKEATAAVDVMKRQIWESLEVNEAMMGKMPQGRKNAGQMGAMQQEQQINITDHATRYEQEMLNPLLEMIFELDQQFRTDEVMIEARGEIGVKASLETIPVQEWEQRYFFRWTGTEFMMGVQRIQQQIAMMNVLKGIPPQMFGGKTLDISPIVESMVENTFGVDLAPRILVDKRNMYTVGPDPENEMLHNGFEVQTHEADDDPEHIQSHMRAAGVNGDPMGLYKRHMQAHMQQLQKKREMMMAQQQAQAKPPGGMPGGPGGGGPGVPGGPRPGAMPGAPRPGGQAPPGAIHSDSMMDPAAGPRG